jgi:hypothetical protein
VIGLAVSLARLSLRLCGSAALRLCFGMIGMMF